MATKASVFETLSKIDVSGHVEKKMNLSYLSWAWAWSTLKSIYPDTPTPEPTTYQEMLLDKNGFKLTDRKVPYLTTPTGTMVEVTVTIEGNDYKQSLYVMDNRNKVVINPDQGQINKTTQRCIVKAIAMAGLGLNLYAGEDLPMGDANEADQRKRNEVAQQKQKASHDSLQRGLEMLADMLNKKPEEIKASLIAEYKDTDLYKKDPTEALLNGTREMYRQVTQENKAKGVG